MYRETSDKSIAVSRDIFGSAWRIMLASNFVNFEPRVRRFESERMITRLWLGATEPEFPLSLELSGGHQLPSLF